MDNRIHITKKKKENETVVRFQKFNNNELEVFNKFEIVITFRINFQYFCYLHFKYNLGKYTKK